MNRVAKCGVWSNNLCSMKIVVLGALLFQLSTVVGAVLDPPDILSPGSHLTVKAGAGLILNCHGDAPLHWEVTHIPTDERFKFDYSYEENNETVSRPYATGITVSNVSSSDAGIFTCAYNNSDDNPSGEGQRTIYVFVDDPTKNLVDIPGDQDFLNVYHGQSLTIPCRPTSPLVEVTLSDSGIALDLNENNYDSRFGYKIDSVNPTNAGVYFCTGRRDDYEERKTWVVHILKAPSFQPSILRTPLVTATEDGAINVGSDFTLNCTTEEESYVYYNINWTEPRRVLESGRARFDIIPIITPRNSKRFTAQLTIHNATKEDSDIYVCRVWSIASSKNVTKAIRVYDSGDRFINITTTSTHIQEKAKFNAQWVINLLSYPRAVDFIWKDRNGREIGRNPQDPKFRIERKNNVIKLRILEVTLLDAGAYVFYAALKDFPDIFQTLDLHLTVLEKPTVWLKPRDAIKYVEYGKPYDLTCNAKGYPIPRIVWFFLETQTFDEKLPSECGGRGMQKLKAFNVTQGDRHWNSSTLHIVPNKHGILRCSAINQEGLACQQKQIKVIDYQGESGFEVIVPSVVIDEDTVNLTCAVSKLNGTSDLIWKKKNSDGQFVELNVDNTSVINMEEESEWSWKRTITFTKINKERDAGEYVCFMGGGGQALGLNRTANVVVNDAVPPTIVDTNLNGTHVTFREGEPAELQLYCRTSGAPKPVIEWTKDGIPASEWPSDIKHIITDDGESLIFSYIRSFASGTYSCIATNRKGSDSALMEIEVEGNGTHPFLIVIIVACVIIILILMFCMTKKIYKQKEAKRLIKELQQTDFIKGAVENINPELGIEDQANLLPYEHKWEFPRGRLRLGMQLGSGAFGRVMKADAIGILPEEPVTTVAVKMVKANADESHLKALMSELKIMIHLGQHVNVVNLLGAVTTNLMKKKELLVIVEYCKYGSLLTYMHKHRHTFVNQLDATRGCIDSSIYRQVSRHSQQSEPPRLNYASLTFTDTGNSRVAPSGYRTLEEIPPVSPTNEEIQLRPLPRRVSDDYQHDNKVESMCTDMSYISTAPHSATNDGNRRSSGTSSWGDGHYRGDYHHVDVRPIRSVDLLCWAFQIARGMEYLAARKVLHGDLAARNVLLADHNVVKICDFGLAKEIYKGYNYKKKSEGVLLPVKWMAIESIYYGVFSTQSDVWSFGVVLWELFTLGKAPYPGMEADERFFKLINEGYRMEKPSLSPSSIYDIMMECWANESSSRPTFSALVDRIGDLMDEGHRQQYLDLNVPYDKMNREWLSEREDYLSRMGGPEFESNSTRVTPEREYQNVPKNLDPQTSASGYLIPISPNQPNDSTQYQNLNHPNRDDRPEKAHEQIIANNAAYVLMNSPHPNGMFGGGGTPYVKFDVEPQPPSGTATNRSYVSFAIDNGGMNNASQENNPASSAVADAPRIGTIDPGEQEDIRPFQSTAISNQNYVSNNILSHQDQENPPSFAPASNNISAPESLHNHHKNRNLRQKNDSGLGSIDSNHFDHKLSIDRPGSQTSELELELDSSSSTKDGCSHTNNHRNADMLLNGKGVIVG